MATHPYCEHQLFPERDLKPAERLEPARATLKHAIDLLRYFSEKTERAAEGLRDEQLETICKAVDQALYAAENVAYMGYSDFNPRPLETVSWVH